MIFITRIASFIGVITFVMVVSMIGSGTAFADGAETGWFDTYEYYTPDTGWYDNYEYYTPDTGWYDTYEYYTPDTGWYDSYEYYTPTSDYEYAYTNDYGYYDVYEYGSYSSGSSGGGYSYPTSVGRPSIVGSGAYSYPVTIGSGYSTASYPRGSATPTSISNIDNSVTITDNSINDSFNNYNSNNIGTNIQSPGAVAAGTSVSVTPLTTPTHYAGYTYPTYNPTYTYPTYTQPAPYVALSQIPYTGFDYGPFGNSLYWIMLASIAVGGAYLLVYYRGGVAGVIQEVLTGNASVRNFTPAPIMSSAPVAAPTVEEDVLDEVEIKTRAVDRYQGTRDTMGIVMDGGIPRIAISRA